MADPSDTMSVLKNYRVGLNNVGSYQVAGRPFITGSEDHAKNTEQYYAFPSVVSSVQVAALTTDTAGNTEEIRIHFNSKDSGDVIGGSHDFVLTGSHRHVNLNMKCKEIYVSIPNEGSATRRYRIAAELTQIPRERMFELTGSGLTTSKV
jgi:hypothetical protein|tara:strand:- start:369 stop:818 length:450 start_codon:yes stop_codon:yes gene_type:complete